MLEHLYEGWGFDEGPIGMETLADQGVIGHDKPFEKDIELVEAEQFFGESGVDNTDLKQAKCACH